MLFLELKQLICQSQGRKGQQRLLVQPTAGPAYLVFISLLDQFHGFTDPILFGSGLEGKGYAKKDNGSIVRSHETFSAPVWSLILSMTASIRARAFSRRACSEARE